MKKASGKTKGSGRLPKSGKPEAPFSTPTPNPKDIKDPKKEDDPGSVGCKTNWYTGVLVYKREHK